MDSRLGYLGIQNASRKPRIDNSPWPGGLLNTIQMEIKKYSHLIKMYQIKRYFTCYIIHYLENNIVKLDNKTLERIWEHFCHYFIVFEILYTFLKRVHLTLSSHLPMQHGER